MKRAVFYSLVALVLVLGLILPMAIPVMASQITATKDPVPNEAPYEAGETIHFVMTITNPGDNQENNILTNIWDTLPDGSTYYFVEEGVDSPLVQLPGDTDTFYLDYQVDCSDVEYNEGLGYWVVKNQFEAEGYDTAEDDVYTIVTSSPQVIPCEAVGGEAFPIGKPSVLVPWIVLGAAIVAGATVFLRRRHVRS